jgi:hypothetical protein
MRWKLLALFIGPCLCNTGCSMYAAIAKNAVQVPTIMTDDCLIEKQSKLRACAAWREVVAKSGEEHFSPAYQDGFIDGYSDYLVHGGKGEPPPVPPLRYLLLHDQNPQGRDKQEQWFAGFRHGAALAIRSGQREYITVPLSTVWPPNPYGVVYSRVTRAPTRKSAAEEGELLPLPHEEPGENLPPPRLMPEEPQAGGPELFPQATPAALEGNVNPGVIAVGFSAEPLAELSVPVPAEAPVSATDVRSSQPSRGLLYRWLTPQGPHGTGEEIAPVLSRQP